MLTLNRLEILGTCVGLAFVVIVVTCVMTYDAVFRTRVDGDRTLDHSLKQLARVLSKAFVVVIGVALAWPTIDVWVASAQKLPATDMTSSTFFLLHSGDIVRGSLATIVGPGLFLAALAALFDFIAAVEARRAGRIKHVLDYRSPTWAEAWCQRNATLIAASSQLAELEACFFDRTTRPQDLAQFRAAFLFQTKQCSFDQLPVSDVEDFVEWCRDIGIPFRCTTDVAVAQLRGETLHRRSSGVTVEPARAFIPRGPLKATGYKGPPDVKGKMALGLCETVDAELVGVFAELTQVMYAVASAARTIKDAPDPQRHALEQILVASLAIAATEAETAVTLYSFDLAAPAAVHVRSLGDIARRFQLLPAHRDVALQMYGALTSSRAELAKKIPSTHPVREAFTDILETAQGQRTMEAIEHDAYASVDTSHVFISPLERRLYSKWNHADIIALADAGQRLLAADEDLRTALNGTPDTSTTMLRACEFVFAILYTAQALLGVKGPPLDALLQRYAAIAERAHAQGNAQKDAFLAWRANSAKPAGDA
jgi:hypothetical protein